MVCVLDWLGKPETQSIIYLTGIGFTAYFSSVLWKTTKRLGKGNYKIALYKHRLECYQKIADVFYNLSNEMLSYGISLAEGKISVSDVIRKLIENKNILFKAKIEAKTLFSEEFTTIVNAIYEQYSIINNSMQSLLISEFINKFHFNFGFFVGQNGLKDGNILDNYQRFIGNKENLESLFNEFPEFKDYIEASEKLQEIDTKSGLPQMFYKEINIKNLKS